MADGGPRTGLRTSLEAALLLLPASLLLVILGLHGKHPVIAIIGLGLGFLCLVLLWIPLMAGVARSKRDQGS